jgi:hypothetical protein
MNGARASPERLLTRCRGIRRNPPRRTRRTGVWDDPAMDDPVPARRRDPAWRWYVLAAAALTLVLVLELTGVFDLLGP